MNLVDLIIFLSLIFFAWLGSRIGILATISSILSGLFGSIVANLLYMKFVVFLPPRPSSLLISYFVIFFSVSAAIFYLGNAVSKLISFMFLGLIDRFLGALAGMALGIIICGALIMVAITIPSIKIRYYVKNSTFGPVVMNRIMAPSVKPFSKKNYEALTKNITGDVIGKIKSLPGPLK